MIKPIDMQQAIVSALHRIGPMLKKDLIGMTGATQTDINEALKNGLIVNAEEYGDVTYAASNKGCRNYDLSTRKSRVATARSFMTDTPYDAAELKPFTGRPGCNDAMALPSRQFNTLIYRDGRVVTL